MFQFEAPIAASPVKARFSLCQSRKFRYETSTMARWPRGFVSQQVTSRLGSRMGRGRRTTAWTALKIALLAPMARDSERTAEAV